jgi:hypothetical protein
MVVTMKENTLIPILQKLITGNIKIRENISEPSCGFLDFAF